MVFQKGHKGFPKKDKEPSQQSAAVQARWAAEEATEEGLRKYFSKQVTVEEGLAILVRMRKNAELAGEVLNVRITSDVEKERCHYCGQTKPINKQWCLVRAIYHPVTRKPVNQYFCSPICVAMENKRQGGTAGIADRGMMPSDNPENHPVALAGGQTAKSSA